MKSESIYFDDDGNGGIPVVFIHSLAGNTGHWAEQLAHIRQTRRGIALDLRGHGRSSQPADGKYTLDSLAEDVRRVVSHLDLGKFVLVGHSMGGAAAAAFAGKYPQFLAGLLLVDPPGDSSRMPEAEVQQYLGAMESEAYEAIVDGYWAQILTGGKKGTFAKVMADLHSTSKQTVVEISKELFGFNSVPAVASYDGPKLSVITPLQDTQVGLHTLVDNLPTQLITGTGHWPHMDKPDEFNQILDGFIEQVEVTSQGLNDGPLKTDTGYPAVIACNLIDSRMKYISGSPKSRKTRITHKNDERFITGLK